MKRTTAFVCAIVAVLTLAGQDVSAQSGSGDWQFTIAPYLLGAAMDGTVGVGDQRVDLDLSFSDIVENLQFGGMGYFAMKNDAWLLSAQVVSMNLQQEQGVSNGTAEVTVKETLAEFLGGWRMSERLTFLAGVRMVDLSTDLVIAGSLGETRREGSERWFDPFVGAQYAVPLSDTLWIDVRGDVGGFGIGSDMTWQAWGDLGFRASELVSVFVGYHALDIDYEDGSGTDYFRYDVMASGPQLGVAFHF